MSFVLELIQIHIAAVTTIITFNLLPSGLVGHLVEQRVIKSGVEFFDTTPNFRDTSFKIPGFWLFVPGPLKRNRASRSRLNQGSPRTDPKGKAAAKVGVVLGMTAATVTAAARVAASRAVAAAARRSLAQAVAVPTVINQDDDMLFSSPPCKLAHGSLTHSRVNLSVFT